MRATGWTRREVVVVVAGVVTGGVLLVVSGLGTTEPRVEGELALARVGHELADAAHGAWATRRRAEVPCETAARVTWRATDEAGPLDVAAPRPLDDEPPGPDDALARAILDDAGDGPDAFAPLEGRAFGAAVTVAVDVAKRRAGHDVGLRLDEPAATWRSLPVPVALALASPPSEPERAALADAWGADRLPVGAPPTWTFEEAPICVQTPREGVLAARVLGADLAAEVARRRAARALARLVGRWPAPPDERWTAIDMEIKAWRLLARAPTDVEREALWVPTDAPLAAVRADLVDAGLVPDGFALTPPDEAPRDELVRPAERRAGLAFAVVHDDRHAFVAAQSARAAWLRRGLIALAAAIVVTALLVARALRRDRRLVEARAAFVASVSHELRTPVASILALAENLEEGRASPDTRERTPRLIRREAERLRRLVDDVLDVSRLERGGDLRPRLDEHAARPWFARTADELRRLAASSERAFDCDAGDVPDRVWIDGELLRRALVNLVDNALRHGAGTVRVRAGRDDERWWICVEDEGAGVPPPERRRAFERFERLDRSDRAGAGLGLGIVREIVTAHGGDVALVDPPSGRGACVRIDLPDPEPRP